MNMAVIFGILVIEPEHLTEVDLCRFTLKTFWSDQQIPLVTAGWWQRVSCHFPRGHFWSVWLFHYSVCHLFLTTQRSCPASLIACRQRAQSEAWVTHRVGWWYIPIMEWRLKTQVGWDLQGPLDKWLRLWFHSDRWDDLLLFSHSQDNILAMSFIKHTRTHTHTHTHTHIQFLDEIY